MDGNHQALIIPPFPTYSVLRTGLSQGQVQQRTVLAKHYFLDENKSTKGSSKLRRDLINSEIGNLRNLLPLPPSTCQRLSQLQLMALVCVYIRKANYFQEVWRRKREDLEQIGSSLGFAKALSGFLLIITQNGKLLYISDNAAEYLGHSMEDLLIHGDSVYDIIDKADHNTVQAQLLHSVNPPGPAGAEERRRFLCRMNVSRNARRQMRFGDQKVVLVAGHFLSHLPLHSRNEPVFLAVCTPLAMPETRECVVQGATNVFTSIHHMDMKFIHIDRNGEHYLGYSRAELSGLSWYELIHWTFVSEAESKHRQVSQSEDEKACILLLRLRTRSFHWIWIHCVLQVREGQDTKQSVIVATNQVLSEQEAVVMQTNSWIYHYYTVHTKLQYGLAYPETPSPSADFQAHITAASAPHPHIAAYFPSLKLNNYDGTNLPLQLQQHFPPALNHPISPDSAGGYSPTLPPLQRYDWSPSYGNQPWPHQANFSSHVISRGAEDTAPNHYATTPYNDLTQNWPTFAHYPANNASTEYDPPVQYDLRVKLEPHEKIDLRTKFDPPNGCPLREKKSFENLSARPPEMIASLGGHKCMRKRRAILNDASDTMHMPYRTRFLANEIVSHEDSIIGGAVVTTRAGDLTSRRKMPGLRSQGAVELVLKDEPASPSPLGEGHTHRVPDLRSFSRAESEGRLSGAPPIPELVHCVPSWNTDNFPYYYCPQVSIEAGGVKPTPTNVPSACADAARAKGSSAL